MDESLTLKPTTNGEHDNDEESDTTDDEMNVLRSLQRSIDQANTHSETANRNATSQIKLKALELTLQYASEADKPSALDALQAFLLTLQDGVIGCSDAEYEEMRVIAFCYSLGNSYIVRFN